MNSGTIIDLAWKFHDVRTKPIEQLRLSDLENMIRDAEAYRDIGIVDGEQREALTDLLPELEMIRVFRVVIEDSLVKR